MLLGALSIVVATRIGVRWPWFANKQKLELPKNTILLADFANSTSDSVFDSALKEGLAADLGQSTFLNIVSGDAVSRQLPIHGPPHRHSPDA